MVLKYVKIMMFVLLFSCGENYKGSRDNVIDSEEEVVASRNTGDDSKADRRQDEADRRPDEADRRQDEADSDYAEIERRRLRGDFALKTTVDSRYSSGSASSFSGLRECGDSLDCKDICNRIIKGSKSKCYSFSESVVEEMEEAFLTIRNIESDRVNIDPYIFEAILTASRSTLEDLVEDEMSEGDLKSFLAWVAINEDIAEVLDKKDRSGQILEEAFKQLGEHQEGAISKSEFVGLNTGLITVDDTFFALTAEYDNEEAFIMAYDILNSGSCRTITCQEQILCARENRSRSSSARRIFGYSRTNICRTSANTRSSYRSASCYVHGSAVWSFLYELIEDKDIRGAPKALKAKPLGVTRCNQVCGKNLSKSDTCNLYNPKALR